MFPTEENKQKTKSSDPKTCNESPQTEQNSSISDMFKRISSHLDSSEESFNISHTNSKLEENKPNPSLLPPQKLIPKLPIPEDSFEILEIHSEINQKNVYSGPLSSQQLHTSTDSYPPFYHEFSKSLFLNEQEWRFNHRYTGKNFMNKIQKYVLKSHPCPKKAIITVLNLSEPYYAHVSDG